MLILHIASSKSSNIMHYWWCANAIVTIFTWKNLNRKGKWSKKTTKLSKKRNILIIIKIILTPLTVLSNVYEYNPRAIDITTISFHIFLFFLALFWLCTNSNFLLFLKYPFTVQKRSKITSNNCVSIQIQRVQSSWITIQILTFYVKYAHLLLDNSLQNDDTLLLFFLF